jgi:hypothetical protein
MTGQMNGDILVGTETTSQYYNCSLKGDGGHSIEFRRRVSDCFVHAGFYPGF